jgi:hypothetical protein
VPLLSLLVAILLTPALNQDDWRRLVLVAITFIPIILSIVRLSQIKRWVWPSVLLALGNAVFVVAGNTFPSPTLTGIRWAFLAAFFGLTATGLFSYLRNSRSVAQAELYTAVQHLLIAWVAVGGDLSGDRRFLSRFNPDWKRPIGPSDRAALFQPDNALYRRIRRYRAAQRNGPHTNGTGRGDGGSLHSDYGGGFGRQVQERILGVTALDREL